MNTFITGAVLFTFLFLESCNLHSKKDYILRERNLIPEGTAFDNRSGTIYIGSTFKRKIIQIASDGKISDFIPEKLNGITSIVGMEVDEDRDMLWANTAHANEVMPLMDPAPTRDWTSSICSFDISSKKQIKEYELRAEKSFLNDLTVLPAGDVFVTESVNNKIYRIPKQTDSLEPFLTLPGFTFLNGITYSDKFNCLFVSAVEGIIKIDLATKKYYLVKIRKNIDAGNIDGLTFYKNMLLAHQSSKLTMFRLNKDGSEIIEGKILDSGHEFDSSTTGEIGDRCYYFIVNSQIRSGIDQATATIKPVDSLKDVIIRRIKL